MTSERRIMQIHTEYNEQSGHGVYVVCEDGTAWVRVTKREQITANVAKARFEWERIVGPPAASPESEGGR